MSKIERTLVRSSAFSLNEPKATRGSKKDQGASRVGETFCEFDFRLGSVKARFAPPSQKIGLLFCMVLSAFWGSALGGPEAQAGVSKLTLDSEVGLGWLSQGIGMEGVFLRADARERNILLRRDELERIRRRRKGLSPIRWWGGYRLSRPAFVGIGDAGITEEWGHQIHGGLGARLFQEFEIAFDITLQDIPTDSFSSGGVEIFPTWMPAPGWRVELRAGVFGFQKRAGGEFVLSDGTTSISTESEFRTTEWSLSLQGDLSPQFRVFAGGGISVFGDDPAGVVQSLNAFLELTPAQVVASSGLSPLRGLYRSLSEYRVGLGFRFGGIQDDLSAYPETQPWYLELRGDWTQPKMIELPIVFRVIPAFAYRFREDLRFSLEPEIWISDTGVTDWLANLGVRVNL